MLMQFYKTKNLNSIHPLWPVVGSRTKHVVGLVLHGPAAASLGQNSNLKSQPRDRPPQLQTASFCHPQALLSTSDILYDGTSIIH
jgi:hypothetical protein